MIKKLIVLLSLVLASALFAQESAPMPTLPAPVFPVPPMPPNHFPGQPFPRQFHCGTGDDVVVVASWSMTSEIIKSCVGDRTFKSAAICEAPGVQQFAARDESSFYALSHSGKLTLYTDYAGARIDQWRVHGNHIVGVENNMVDMRIPHDREEFRYFLYGSSNYFTEQLKDEQPGVRTSCAQNTRLWQTGFEACIDPSQNVVWIMRGNPFSGPNYFQPQEAFRGEYAVSIAGQGDTFYALLGNKYEYPEVPGAGPQAVPITGVIPGKLVAFRMDRDGKVHVEVIVRDLNLPPLTGHYWLAASEKRLYFIHIAGKGKQSFPRVSYYDLKTKQVGVLRTGGPEEFFGAIGVLTPPTQRLPNQQNRL